MGEPVDGEAAGLGFLFEDEQDARAAAIGPFEQQRGVQFAKPFAQAFLELLLPDGDDAGRIEAGTRFIPGEERRRFPGVVEYKVLEVLVVQGV